MRIVSDSSLNVDNEMIKNIDLTFVPFSVLLDDETWVDKENVNIEEFTFAMKKSKTFKSACPSPNDYLEAIKNDGDVFILTISQKLSGSYNSAMNAKRIYEEKYGFDKKIHVFDSKSAAAGMTLVFLELKKLINKSIEFNEIVRIITQFIEETNVLFVSLSLDNLRKAGRLSNLKAVFAKTFNIVPVMGAEDGNIILISKLRGAKKAYSRMIDLIGEKKEDFSNKIITIVHANNINLAKKIKESIKIKYNPLNIFIIQASVLNTLYADDKGIILAF